MSSSTRSRNCIVSACGLLALSFLAACGEEPQSEPDQPEAETTASVMTPLAEYKEDNRHLSFYRAPGVGLVMQQETPAGQAPLVRAAAMAGRLPSEVFANVAHQSPPKALVDVEHELELEPAPGTKRDESALETKRSALTSSWSDTSWFSTNFCDSADLWEAFKTTGAGDADILSQYFLTDIAADRLITPPSGIFGYSAVFNFGGGSVVNKILLQDGTLFQTGAVTLGRTATQLAVWSDTRKVCGPFGCCCLQAWNQRKYSMGVRGVSSGEVADICGFTAGWR
jgi:hypothetical protein